MLLTAANSTPYQIVTGPDGNLWFTEYGGNRIGRITPDGQLTEFALPTTLSRPNFITVGPDGNLWFTELVVDAPGVSYPNRIGRITPDGQLTEFALPYGSSSPRGITVGPDGNLWYVAEEGNRMGEIAADGTVTEIPLPSPGSQPYAIVMGPDGNLWYTELTSNRIGRLAPGVLVAAGGGSAPGTPRGTGRISLDLVVGLPAGVADGLALPSGRGASFASATPPAPLATSVAPGVLTPGEPSEWALPSRPAELPPAAGDVLDRVFTDRDDGWLQDMFGDYQTGTQVG
jgi:hypothetical protein